jgi:hypothetical protein
MVAECPACAVLCNVIGFDMVRQTYLAYCVHCKTTFAAPDVTIGHVVEADEPKPETWRDRAIRDPML